MDENTENISVKISDMEEPAIPDFSTDSFYRRVNFADQEINVFTEQQLKDTEDNTEWYPVAAKKGLYFKTVGQLEIERPEFIKQVDWEDIQKKSAGFITGLGTLMPRMVFPTDKFCCNGIKSLESDIATIPAEGTEGEEGYKPEVLGRKATKGKPVKFETYGKTFNWTFSGVNAIQTESMSFFCDVPGKDYGYINAAPKRKTKKEIDAKLLEDKVFTLMDEETGGIVGNNIGGAAFAITYDFDSIPKEFLKKDADDTQKESTMLIEFGSFNMTIVENGEFSVDYLGNTKTFSLISSIGTIAPKQATFDEDIKKRAKIALIYPVWNGVVASGGIQDSVNLRDAGYYFKNKSDIDLLESSNPSLKSFPKKATSSDSNSDSDLDDDVTEESIVIETSKTMKMDWGDSLHLTLQNANAFFSYTPAYFLPKCDFCVYFEAQSSDAINDYEYYAYVIYSINESQFEVKDKKIKAVPLGEKSPSGTQMYRFDFSIFVSADTFQRRAAESWGFIEEKIVKQKAVRVYSQNGKFEMIYSGGGAVPMPNWYDYLQSVTISRGLSDSSGSLTLDKYGMMLQTEEVTQSIGGIKIETLGGNPNVITAGHVFSGIAMEIGNNISANSDTLSVSLYGLEKKLRDIRLINVPFWDGDKLSKVLDFMSNYAGFKIKTVGSENDRLPRSSEFEAPAVNFPLGTTVYDALQEMAVLTNNAFYIDVDGTVVFSKRNVVGIPKVCYEEPKHIYESNITVSMNGTPDYSELHNAFYSVALMAKKDGSRNMVNKPTGDLMPGIVFEHVTEQTPKLPWSKIKTDKTQGYITYDELKVIHENNKAIGSSYMQTGNATVPGTSAIKLLDSISFSGEVFYVYKIDHNIDLQNKSWTTTVGISKTVELPATNQPT